MASDETASAPAHDGPRADTPVKAPRNSYVDALRGWAILLVVLGHASQRVTAASGLLGSAASRAVLPHNYATVTVFSFGYWHMPLFMAVSGYVIFGRIRHPVPAWLNRKALALLVPFVSWSVVYYWVPDKFFIKRGDFVDYLVYTIAHPGNGLWYLPALFVFYALTAWGEDSAIGDWSLLVIGLVIAVLPPSQLLGVAQIQTVWWWFALGYLFAKFQDNLLGLRFWAWALAVVAYPLSLYQVIHFKNLAFVPLLTLAGVVGSTLLVWLLTKVWLTRSLAYLGCHTLEIYAAEFLFLSLPIGVGLFRIPLVTAVAVAGSLAVGVLLRLTPLTDALFLGGRYRAPGAQAPMR